MTTPTRAEQVAKFRGQKAEQDDGVDLFDELQQQRKVVNSGEILEHMAQVLTSEEIGRMLAMQARSDNKQAQRQALQMIMDLALQYEKSKGSVTEAEVAALEDDQINALLEAEYGLKKNGKPAGPAAE